MGMLDTKNHWFWYNFVCPKPTEKVNAFLWPAQHQKETGLLWPFGFPFLLVSPAWFEEWTQPDIIRCQVGTWSHLQIKSFYLPQTSASSEKKWIVSFALNHLPPHQRKIIPCHPSLWFHKVHQLTNHIAGGPSRDNLISQSVHGKKVYMSAMSTNMRHGMHLPKCPIHQYVDRNA